MRYTQPGQPGSVVHLSPRYKMRVFQEEIFGPVLAVTTFKDEAEALDIANDTLYGLGGGVWTRDGSRAFRVGRGTKASADLFGLTKADLIDQVKDIITVGEFYDMAVGGEIIFT